MEHVSSVRPTGKFPEKVGNSDRNDQTGQSGSPSKLVPNIPVGTNWHFRNFGLNGNRHIGNWIGLIFTARKKKNVRISCVLILKRLTALFTNMRIRIVKFESQQTIAFFATVRHLNGPLRKQTLLNGFKRSWFVICDWSISIHFVCFCVSRFVACDRNCDWRQHGKTQLRRRLMNLRVRMFVKSAVKDHKFCCSYDWLVTTSCRPIRSVISVMKQITLSPHDRQILFYHLYD